MTKPETALTNRRFLADFVATLAALALVGMLCTIGVELVVVAARYFGTL